MSNSSLVNYVKISPNSSNPRNNKIKKITIHHMAGNASVETCGNIFANPARKASSNYGIGSDGRVGMYVEEKNRSWCSSSPENDNQAITIEVANDVVGGNWHVSDKALAKLIDLCVDICKRNGIEKLNYTGDKNGNLTMHKWFAATACPGPYLESKFPYIAKEVNKRLGGNYMSFKINDKNDGVYAVKRELMTAQKLGIIKQKVNDDNIFGTGTQAAVKEVQKAAGLTQSGVADTATIKALGNLIDKAVQAKTDKITKAIDILK